MNRELASVAAGATGPPRCVLQALVEVFVSHLARTSTTVALGLKPPVGGDLVPLVRRLGLHRLPIEAPHAAFAAVVALLRESPSAADAVWRALSTWLLRAFEACLADAKQADVERCCTRDADVQKACARRLDLVDAARVNLAGAFNVLASRETPYHRNPMLLYAMDCLTR